MVLRFCICVSLFVAALPSFGQATLLIPEEVSFLSPLGPDSAARILPMLNSSTHRWERRPSGLIVGTPLEPDHQVERANRPGPLDIDDELVDICSQVEHNGAVAIANVDSASVPLESVLMLSILPGLQYPQGNYSEWEPREGQELLEWEYITPTQVKRLVKKHNLVPDFNRPGVFGPVPEYALIWEEGYHRLTRRVTVAGNGGLQLVTDKVWQIGDSQMLELLPDQIAMSAVKGWFESHPEEAREEGAGQLEEHSSEAEAKPEPFEGPATSSQ